MQTRRLSLSRSLLCWAIVLMLAAISAVAQISSSPATPTPTPVAAAAPASVPPLVLYSGLLAEVPGGPAEVSVTFLIFKGAEGGEPLWMETQMVAADAGGRYSVHLGAANPAGLPGDLFETGEASWLEVQAAGQRPQTRVLLSSVPYALKAGDAATLGGLPASAFLRAGAAVMGQAADPSAAGLAATTMNVTTTGGTANYVPRFNGTSSVINSQIYDTGASVGIGNIPASGMKLDVGGPMITRGSMTLSRGGTANATKGYPSFGFDFLSNVYNSSTHAGVNPFFQLQSEPVGNNTASPSATFNLLFSNNGAAAAETGFYINPNGKIHFAPGQAFPGTGTGNGTLTGVTAGTALTGGGTTGAVTLNVDTSKVPLLNTINNFTATQSILNGGLNIRNSGLYMTNSGLSASSTGTTIYAQGKVGVYGLATASGASAFGVQGSSTNATAVRGDDKAGGFGVYGTSAAGFGVYGQSGGASGLGASPGALVGDSYSARGVSGGSDSADGVHGINRHGAAGVSGENMDQGFGLYGVSHGSGQGVWGESFGTASVHGIGDDGVHGQTHTTNGAGVSGTNDASGGIGVYGGGTNAGIGVYGSSQNSGYGFVTDSNVQQARGMGGWVKAMAYVDPFASGGIAVTRCFNSQASGAAVYTPPCGISIPYHAQGYNYVDFGFEVDDRFVNATANAQLTTIGVVFQGLPSRPLTSNQVVVITNNSYNSDVPFTLMIY